MDEQLKFDALIPPEMARLAERIGTEKATTTGMKMFTLAILAGAFIAMGAAFATTVSAGTSSAMPYGITRLLTGLSFCLGLVLVVVGGAELFTGNNLIVMAWASGRVSTYNLLRNWVIVYVGNFVGSVGIAVIMFLARQYTFAGGTVGFTALTIANSKVNLGFVQALALGTMCNLLVCLAVWLSFSGHSTVDKIAAIIFPIMAFVACGFEHSVANMYFIPIGLFIRQFDPSFTAGNGLELTGLTWGNFLFRNLLPVTVGNIIGGGVLVAAIYWFVYLRPRREGR